MCMPQAQLLVLTIEKEFPFLCFFNHERIHYFPLLKIKKQKQKNGQHGKL